MLAPASMTEVLEALGEEWAGQGNRPPVLSFAGTPALARQIVAGAPADIVVSADAQWMDWMVQRNLVNAQSRSVLAGNALALVSHQELTGEHSIAELLARPGTERLAMADSELVPAGRYGKAALQEMGLWLAVKDTVIPTDNVRMALALAERGEADLALVYASDLQLVARSLSAIAFEPEFTPQITYPAALVEESQHKDAAAFLAFLNSSQARAIFVQHGFVSAEEAAHAQ